MWHRRVFLSDVDNPKPDTSQKPKETVEAGGILKSNSRIKAVEVSGRDDHVTRDS